MDKGWDYGVHTNTLPTFYKCLTGQPRKPFFCKKISPRRGWERYCLFGWRFYKQGYK